MNIHQLHSNFYSAMRSLFLVVLVVGAMLIASMPSQADAVTLRLVHAVNSKHPYHLGALAFAEQVERLSDGEIRVEVFADGVFGGEAGTGERAQVEALLRGEVEIVISGTAVLSYWAPELEAMDLPFLIRDNTHADIVLDGPVGSRLLDLLDERSSLMKPLGIWEQGFRHLTNSRGPVLVPEDVRGLHLRVQENPIHIASFEMLGANAVPLPWDQALEGLRAGEIAGQENPLTVIGSYQLYEVHPYLALTGHFYAPAMMIMNQDVYDALSPQNQAILLRASADASREARRLGRILEAEEIQRLQSAGMQVTRPNKELFRQAMTSIYDAVTDSVERELVTLIKKADNDGPKWDMSGGSGGELVPLVTPPPGYVEVFKSDFSTHR